MASVMEVDVPRCDGSPWCPAARVCPRGALRRREDGRWEIDAARCTGCGVCVRACPAGAVGPAA